MGYLRQPTASCETNSSCSTLPRRTKHSNATPTSAAAPAQIAVAAAPHRHPPTAASSTCRRRLHLRARLQHRLPRRRTLCGAIGSGSLVDEDWLLDLERKNFMSCWRRRRRRRGLSICSKMVSHCATKEMNMSKQVQEAYIVAATRTRSARHRAACSATHAGRSAGACAEGVLAQRRRRCGQHRM